MTAVGSGRSGSGVVGEGMFILFWLKMLSSKVYDLRLLRRVALEAVKCMVRGAG